MILKYTFPVPQHGEFRNKEIYVDSISEPTRRDLLSLLGQFKDQAETDQRWSELEDWSACMFALQHLKDVELPRLNGSKNGFIRCDTPLKKLGSIFIELIKTEAVSVGSYMTENTLADHSQMSLC